VAGTAVEQALAALRSGAAAPAVDHIQAHLRAAPDDAQARELLAVALAQLERFVEAERELRWLIAWNPAAAQYPVYLAALLLQLNRDVEASELLSRVLSRHPDFAPALMNMGITELRLGKPESAVDHFRRLRRLAPASAAIGVYEARALIGLERLEEAKALLSAMPDPVAAGPDVASDVVATMAAAGDAARAEELARRAVAANPTHARLRGQLAHLLENLNQVEAAEDLAATLPDGDATAMRLRARLAYRRGDHQRAIALLDALGAEVGQRSGGGADAERVAQLAFDRAQVLDRLGRYDEAFSEAARGNALDRAAFQKMNPHQPVKGGLSELRARPKSAALQPQVLRRGIVEPSAEKSPVFLVGFPRSGTTLLDQMLDAHPGVAVMEERPMVAAVLTELQRTAGGEAAFLAQSVPSEAARLRAVYWREAARFGRLKTADEVFIDKNPFNLCHADLLQYLFPEARWIFAFRHPLDNILSCHLQRFRYTAYSHGFWSPEETAAIFRDAFNIWMQFRGQMQLRVFDVRYEALVVNTKEIISQLISFLDLPWDDAVLRHYEHARGRRIATPSYDQVVRPVYRDAVYRWRCYAGPLAGAAILLKDQISALGYNEID
jgi:Thioredoxin domain-containing protein